MRNILILAVSSLIVGCASAPEFPQIQYHYLVVAMQSKQACLRYRVLSVDPWKLSDKAEEFPLQFCHLVAGFEPQDVQAILNWKDDVKQWAKDNCRK